VIETVIGEFTPRRPVVYSDVQRHVDASIEAVEIT
jgi:hypothetical protein